MAWSWVAAQLSGMVAGEFKLISTNRPHDVALARTRANFDAGTHFADDAAVASAVKAAVTGLYAFSGQAVNGDTGTIIHRGGGHSDGGDGSIFRFNTSTLAWELYVKGPRYESTAPTVSCNVTGITPGTPPRFTVDADIAISGDQGVITGTTDADGTYQLVRVDATHVDLYNIDGSADGQFTAFAGGSLTDSAGTLTITWNPQGVDASTHYAHTNADGEQVPPIPHTYHHDRWIGNNRYILGGQSVFDGNGGVPQNRLWFLDEDATPKVVRGYHDNRTGNALYLTTEGGAGRGTGDVAYNPWDGHLYTGDRQATIFAFRTYRWSSDFLLKEGIASDGGDAYESFSEGLILPQPGAATKRMFFSITTASAWVGCTDIEAGGTPSQSAHTFASAIFQTGITTGIDGMGRCWDDLNGTIVYWGGGATIGEITPDADLEAWNSQEVTPATPTGDVPTSTGATHSCSIAKIPDNDAYLLVQGGNVYLYARSDIVGGGVSVSAGLATETDTAFSVGWSKALAVGLASETDSAFSVAAGGATRVSLGLATEADSAFAVGGSKSKAAGLAAETDTALAVTADRGYTVGLAAEADTAFSVGHSKAKEVGLATESDQAFAVIGGEVTIIKRAKLMMANVGRMLH